MRSLAGKIKVILFFKAALMHALRLFSVAFGLLGARTSNKIGRDPIVILGFIIHIIAFFLIFLNIPNYANLGDTTDVGKFYAAAVKFCLL